MDEWWKQPFDKHNRYQEFFTRNKFPPGMAARGEETKRRSLDRFLVASFALPVCAPFLLVAIAFGTKRTFKRPVVESMIQAYKLKKICWQMLASGSR